MSSSGYVWFVTDQSGFTAAIPTYGSGTLLVRSRLQCTPVEGIALGEIPRAKRGSVGKERYSNPDPVVASASGPSVTSPTSGLSHSSPPPNPYTSSRAVNTSQPSLREFSVATTSSSSSAPLSIYSNADTEEALSLDPYSAGARFDLTTLGETLYPLFCVSVHERAWISAGFGVWGKEEWLKHFWTVLDWNKVSKAYVKWVPDQTGRI